MLLRRAGVTSTDLQFRPLISSPRMGARRSIMLQHRLLILAMVLVYVPGWPGHKAQAQQAQQDYSQMNPRPTHRGPTLSDVWGPPKMPPEPKDFGPHFDFPAGGSQNLTCGPSSGSQYFCGAPSEAPYMH